MCKEKHAVEGTFSDHYSQEFVYNETDCLQIRDCSLLRTRILSQDHRLTRTENLRIRTPLILTADDSADDPPPLS